jgi:uncharacterized membrane protein YdjX (TVP38/TMEM64 family)
VTPSPARPVVRRAVLLVLGVAMLAVAAALLPLHALPAAVAHLGPVAPVAGIALGTALLMALVPRTPISVACGLIFGAGLGVVCALATMAVAAAATFLAGRLLGRDFAQLAERSGGHFLLRHSGHRAGRAWDRVERWIAREGTLAVAAVRSFPLAPYGLVGYAYGASGVRVRDYALGSLIAGTPSAVAYALLGAAVGGAGHNPLTYTLLPLGLVLTAIVAVRTRLRARSASRPVASATGQT